MLADVLIETFDRRLGSRVTRANENLGIPNCSYPLRSLYKVIGSSADENDSGRARCAPCERGVLSNVCSLLLLRKGPEQAGDEDAMGHTHTSERPPSTCDEYNLA